MAIIPGENGRNIKIDTPQKERSRKLVIFLVVLAMAGAALIYFNSGGSNVPPVDSLASQEQQIDQSNKILDALRSTSLNSQIFTNKNFWSLTASDKLPVTVGDKGRANPFAAF